ncbi:MAG TPA: rhodanese-like domain-containing protein [Gemmatimonadota bacterium]
MPLPVRELAPGVYAVPGDSGRGVEGRANAGFIVTSEGVVVVDALGSPADGERLVAAVRSATDRPIRTLILTHHHPDHHFGAVALRRAGARVLAHPDRSILAAAEGEEALVRDWTRLVGEAAMRGFAFANVPAVPVTRDTVMGAGARRIEILPVSGAHSPADLAVWLPEERVLFAGDLLVEDGVTMVVDGDSRRLLSGLDRLGGLGARIVVPGHGRIPGSPGALLRATREYVTGLRGRMAQAVRDGVPLSRVLAGLPPLDRERPVSRPSREQRNAVRVYAELEREAMGLDERDSAAGPGPAPRGAGPSGAPARRAPAVATLASAADLAALIDRGAVTPIDVRTDVTAYLAGHVPGAVYLHTETLRAGDGGVPNLLLPLESYRTLFSRLGVAADRPVVVYGSGESRNIDATYVAWILTGLGHGDVRVLDGGLRAWELAGRPLERRYPHFTPTAFGPAGFQPERATLEDVRRAIGRDDVVLVDARPPDQYAGLAGPQMRRGHIPGAVNRYWQDDLVEGELARTWRSAAELRAEYAERGITPDREVIAYCNGGLESSHVHFTLRALLGYPRVRVYDGSFTEWAEREELPVETGAPPGADPS